MEEIQRIPVIIDNDEEFSILIRHVKEEEMISLLCGAFMVSAQSDDDSQPEVPQALMVKIEAIDKDEELGAQIPALMDDFLFACAYGEPKVDKTEDNVYHWFGVMTTATQLKKSECTENGVKLAVQNVGVVKTYKIDEKWNFAACTTNGAEGPVISCAKGKAKCNKAAICSNAINATATAVMAIVAFAMLALF